MLEKEEIKIGVKCTGKVSRIMSYGAFVEISEGKDGLCHISEFSTARIENLESVVSVGDPLEVMILNIDDQGRIDLSHRAVAFDEDFETVKERRDSAALKEDGYLYCSSCIMSYVKSHGRSPITLVPSSISSICHVIE